MHAPWQLCSHGMCKILLQLLYWIVDSNRLKFPLNMNCDGKSISEMGAWTLTANKGLRLFSDWVHITYFKVTCSKANRNSWKCGRPYNQNTMQAKCWGLSIHDKLKYIWWIYMVGLIQNTQDSPYLAHLFGRWSKKTSEFCVTGLCVGNSPGTGEFHAQMANNAENSFHLMMSSCCWGFKVCSIFFFSHCYTVYIYI